jgi:hypothetical protein
VAGAFVLLAVARFWFVIHPDPARRAFLPGDFGLGVEGSFYHQLKRGVMPLWDTTLGTGMLFVGGGTHQPTYTIAHLHLFYPLNLLFLGLAEREQAIPIIALHLQHVVHYVLAGLFAYAYGRSLALSVPAAFVVGLVYAFSGFFSSHVSHWTMIDTATWLPLVLLLGRRAMDGRPSAAVWGGLALGMACLAGYPAYVLLIGLALALLALWLIAWRLHDAGGRGVAGLVGRLVLLGLVGGGVGAIQLVPSWHSAATSGQALGDFAFKATGSLPPAALVGLLMPFPLRSLAWWRGNTSEYYLYAGTITLVLVAAALWRVRTRAVAFHALLGGLGVVLALGAHLELFRLLVDLAPGFGYFRYPSRSVLLLSLALATLAGIGLDALRAATDPREFAPLARGLGLVLLVGLPAVLGTLAALVGWEPPAGIDGLSDLLGQEILLLAGLGLGLLALAAAGRAGRARWVTPGVLTVLALDLLLYAFPVPYTTHNPDRHLVDLPPGARFLREQSGVFRIGSSRRLHAQQVHAHRWSVYNSESRLSPRSYVELYLRIPRNPRLLDLLNVRYLVGRGRPEPPGRYLALDVGPDVRQKVVRVPPGMPPGPLRLVSHLVPAASPPQVPQGTEVARLLLRDGAGRETAWPIRAGVETADWAVDRPGHAPGHRRGTVAASWPARDGAYQGHDFEAVFPVEASVPAEVELRYVHPGGSLTVRRLELGGADLGSQAGRFEQRTAEVWENREALPRAFLVPRARALPSRAALLAALETFDPAHEVLLVGRAPRDLVAEGWTARGTVEIVRYEMHRVDLVAEVLDRPQYLVLADRFDRWWGATDNGRPVPILRANLDLRAVRLEPGRHEVRFSLAYPLFAVGASLTGLTLAGAVVYLVADARRRRIGRR